MGNSSDTIAAISTPVGVGGISSVRISGSDAFDVAKKVFIPSCGRFPEGNGWRTLFGIATFEDGEIIDEVIATFMPSPKSYTREDVVELSCHGGFVTVNQLLDVVLTAGARMAEPGEFTKRAYLNGRIDLFEAESVLELINAKTERAKKDAIDGLSGRSASALHSMKEKILHILVEIDASIDFPASEDDDMPDVSASEILPEIEDVVENLNNLISKASEGVILHNGVKVAITGRPNVGKSSILNSILGMDRSIVSDISGTTRDTVEEAANIRGIPLRLIDTAGINDSCDPVEKIGVQRAISSVEKADLVLVVLDMSSIHNSDEFDYLKDVDPKRCIVVLNKSDLPHFVPQDVVTEIFSGEMPAGVIETSALSGEGIEKLKDEIEKLAVKLASFVGEQSSSFSSRRLNCMKRTRHSLIEARSAAISGTPIDLISIDIRDALDAIGEITGETAREDVINQIFSQFCIGK